MRLHQRVAERVRQHRLWAPGDRVAIAVSGGLDSVCLLDLLQRSEGMHRGRLSVVTIDHGTRPGSASDADFVEALAQGRGLDVERVSLALGTGASEATCRAARLAVFDALEVNRVALAHHQRDQVETALLGWLRGSGTAAWAGMAPRRGRLVRPLLDTSRQDLDQHAARHDLRWREDPTNASGRFLRNRVRHELLPVLEGLREGAVSAMARGARHAAEDDALLEALSATEEPWDAGWPAAWIAEAPGPLVRRALRRRLGDLRSTHLDAIRAGARAGHGVVALSPRVRVVVQRGRVLTVEDDG